MKSEGINKGITFYAEGAWTSEPNVMAICPVVVEIFHLKTSAANFMPIHQVDVEIFFIYLFAQYK